jgi:hypothetical protein
MSICSLLFHQNLAVLSILLVCLNRRREVERLASRGSSGWGRKSVKGVLSSFRRAADASSPL